MESKKPCDCIEEVNGKFIPDCYCSNSGDFADAVAWCEEQKTAKELTALRSRVSELEEENALLGKVRDAATILADEKIFVGEDAEGDEVYRVIAWPIDPVKAVLQALEKYETWRADRLLALTKEPSHD